jgi:hypothetical protein
MADKPTSRTPTIFDFQRNLDTIIHRGEREARAEAARLRSEFAAKGMGQSGPLISEVIKRADQIHADTLKCAMDLIVEFSRDSSPIAGLGTTTRQRFESFSVMLVGTVPPAGRPDVAQQIRHQYAAVFQQRLEGALRDIEIGFVDGRRLQHVIPDAGAPATLGDVVILRPTFMGMGIDLQKAWEWLKGFFQ